MRVLSLLIVLAFGFATRAAAAIQVQPVANNVPNLVGIEHPPGDPRLFLVDQRGLIRIYNGTTVLATSFLDIQARVDFGGERGLLGLAFHPNYSSNGFFYVNYISNVSPHTVRR